VRHRSSRPLPGPAVSRDQNQGKPCHQGEEIQRQSPRRLPVNQQNAGNALDELLELLQKKLD
jgi:hypothetical protein